MIMKGQKRKLQPEDAEIWENALALESQRQFVFCVSLNKYQRGQELPEPSLRRSVLIANTLRQISLGASRSSEGNGGSPPRTASAPQSKENAGHGVAGPNRHPHNTHLAGARGASAASNHHNTVSSRSPATCPSGIPNESVRMEDDSEDWESMSSDQDFSLSAAISSILTTLESSADGNPGVPFGQATSCTPLRSLENLSAPAGVPLGDVASKQGVKGQWGSVGESRAIESCVEVMRSSYLGDLVVDDLFQDIDTSLLERDMGALGMRAGGGGHSGGDDYLRYLPPLSSTSSPLSPSAISFSSSPPFSLSFNQSVICLPSFSAFSPASSSCSPSSGQGHGREGLELEHLMEILVES